MNINFTISQEYIIKVSKQSVYLLLVNYVDNALVVFICIFVFLNKKSKKINERKMHAWMGNLKIVSIVSKGTKNECFKNIFISK